MTGAPWFRLEFDCFGTPFTCEAKGPVEIAEAVARLRLSDTFPDFSRRQARMTACIEIDQPRAPIP